LKLGEGVHLTYCSNIHPGESWAEVRANLGSHLLAVRDRLVPDGEFGIGLRLSARAAEELSAGGALDELRQFLARERLYVFTLNGFPFGTFHGKRVKDEVYLPDWRDPQRLLYSNRLADLLARLLPGAGPGDAAIEGSISTVPGAYKPALGGAQDVARMVDHLLQHVAHLVALRARTGRHIALALEPEPCCFLETIEETVAFFESELRAPAAVRRLAELTGLEQEAAGSALREHLGVCLDLCHAAVEYEDATDCVQRLQAAGIRVLKLQISAGLQLPALTRDALDALRRFDDAVYLHQVVERGPGGLVRYHDLRDAFASAEGEVAGREWRVHFHVPIFLERLTPFASTQPFIREMLALQRAGTVSRHLEVETYTWGVLPEALRSGTVDEAVARELGWARAELGA
jgi:hypothetical protein